MGIGWKQRGTEDTLDEESYRIVASAKVERYLSKEKPEYTPEAEVNILPESHV